MTLACATCVNRRIKNHGHLVGHLGVKCYDECKISDEYIVDGLSTVTSPDNCPLGAYKEKISCWRKIVLWSKKKSPNPLVENKGDPRNIAAEMIALDMIKNKLFPTVRSEVGDGSYSGRQIITTFKSDKFEFSIVKKEGRTNFPPNILKVDFVKSNGFELTSYGEKILIEASEKLKKIKEEEEKAKAEHDAKQAALDFIEKRLGLNTPVSSTGKSH